MTLRGLRLSKDSSLKTAPSSSKATMPPVKPGSIPIKIVHLYVFVECTRKIVGMSLLEIDNNTCKGA